MIMASSRRQSRETVLVEDPRWKHGNIGHIDPTDPVKMIHGRQHYLIHWENSSYDAQYADSLYVCKMEDISKMKCTWYSPDEVWISAEQHVSLEGLWKDRALGRRLFEESSSRQWRIVEEDETLELSIDPFAEVPPEETGQKRSPKPLPQHEVRPEETGQKRSPKPPPQQRTTGRREKIKQATAAGRRSKTTGSGEKFMQATAARKHKTTGTTGKITQATADKTTGSAEKIITSR